MRVSLLCGAALYSTATFAFPTNLPKGEIGEDVLAEISAVMARVTREAETKRQSGVEKRALSFNADAQRVSTTDEHKYVAPGPNDLRGPCPGLNAMANHGYLPHNGVSSIVQMTTAANEVFGMGVDLSAFLAVYSAVMAGDLTSFSIGGPPGSGLLGGLGSSLGLLGKPQGLSRSHNRFEGDVSPTRQDLYKTGNPVALDVSLFQQLADMPLGPSGYDLSVMTPWRVNRFRDSKATNGRLFCGAFMQFAIQPATSLFTYQFFANRSAEHPEGYLDLDTMKSFQGVTGNKGNFQWSYGREKIPDNWYKRPVGEEYTIAAFTADAVNQLLENPELIVVGGNTGEPNTFTGVDIGDLTGGVYDSETLLQGNNAMCFALQNVQQGAPDVLRGLVGNLLVAVRKLSDTLDPLIASLGCPQIAKYDKLLLSKFPGAEGAL